MVQEIAAAGVGGCCRDRDLAIALSYASENLISRAPDLTLKSDTNNSDSSILYDLNHARVLAHHLDLYSSLGKMIGSIFPFPFGLLGDINRAHRFSAVNAYIYWELCLALHLLPEAFTDDLNRSLPALGIWGLKGHAGDGWLLAPGQIEWDVDMVTAEVHRDSPKEQWSRYLTENSYDLVFPLTNVPVGQLRRDCQKWRSNRSFRALGVLAYFFLGAEKWFKKHSQAFRELFKVPQIHALIPKPELWLKPFDDWIETDWNTCGLSALWDIKSGRVYWAEGAHSADDMPRVGKLIDEFIASATKAEQGGQNPPELE